MDMVGHCWSSFPSGPDERDEVGLADPQLPTDSVNREAPLIDPTADGLVRDLEMIRDLADRVERRQ